MYSAHLLSRSKPEKARTLDECERCGRTLIRKTSLLRKINPMMRRSSFTNEDIYNPLIVTMGERRNIPEIVNGCRELLREIQTRIDLLFTMS
jgi:ribosomal protein S14